MAADLAAVKRALAAQRIETPSWAFGNSGTRFKVFTQAGVPRTPEEKIADAATATDSAVPICAACCVASAITHITWLEIETGTTTSSPDCAPSDTSIS